VNSLIAAQYNTSRVLRQLWLNPGISRAEIADRLGLNRSTLTHIIKGLSNQGLVRVLDERAAGPLGGRKNVRLSIDPSFGCFAGFDIRADMIRVVGVDIGGEIILKKDIKANATGKRLHAAIGKAYDWLCRRLEELELPLLGVGCGVPGVVDHEERVIKQSNPLDIKGPEALGEALAEKIREPILVDNDANCCCWGEIMARKSIESSSFLFIFGTWRLVRKPTRTHLTAIGMGIAIDDSVHRGKHYSAGEFRSIEWKKGRTSQFSFTDREIALARSDRSVFLKIIKELARNTALLVNVLDLDDLYLGGFFSESDADVRKIFEREIQKNWHYPNAAACELRFSTYGELSVACGAASMFLARAFGRSEDLVLAGDQAGINLMNNQS